MDIERQIRADVVSALTPWCEAIEEAPVACRGGRGRVDVLARPKEPGLRDCSIAIEVKCAGRANFSLGAWIKQAADYVHSEPVNAWPPVVASFLWLPGHDFSSEEHKRYLITALQIAAHFRVGSASYVPRQGLVVSLGPANVLRTRREGWMPHAQTVLFSKRQIGGLKRAPGRRPDLVDDDDEYEYPYE